MSRSGAGYRLVLAVVALLVTAACGATVKLVPTHDAAAVQTQTGAGDTTPTAVDTGGAAATSGGTASGGVAAVRSATTRPPAAATGALGALSAGVTAKEITIGIITFSNTQAATAAGLNGVPTQVGRQSYEMIINDFNRHGDVAGRALKAVYYEIPLTTNKPSATLVAEACAKFTEDNKVFVVLSDRSDYLGRFAGCFAEHGVPFINDYEGYYDQSLVNNNATGTYLPDVPIGQRIMKAWIVGLQRLGYFTAGSKIGLLRSDNASYDRVSAVARPALAAYGLKLESEAEVNTADTSSIGSQVAAAVLKFKSAGVDHVMIMDSAPILTVLFPSAAESQSYRPRYAINSYNTPNFSAANVSPQQLHGAIGIGWFPPLDVVTQPPPNSAITECNATYRAAGVTDFDNTTVAINNQTCALLRFMREASAKAPALNPKGLRIGVEKLGNSYISAIAFSTSFGVGRYDGGQAYRDIGYLDNCSCFQYITPDTHPMP